MQMPHYLCVPADLADDPRTLHLGALTSSLWPDGFLLRIWSWACRQSPDGMIGVYDASVIERSAGWCGTPGALVGALRECGWLLADGTLADWQQIYRVEARRIAERQKKARQRSTPAPQPMSPGQSPGHPLSSLNSKKINSRDHDLGGESERGGVPPAPRMVPTLADPWHQSDPSVLRAYLLAIPGPGPYLALPDAQNPHQTTQDALQARFPAWDGLDGRPTVDQRAQATWDALRGRVAKYTSDPYRALAAWEQWVGDRHDQHAQRLRRVSGDHDPALLLSSLAPRREN